MPAQRRNLVPLISLAVTVILAIAVIFAVISLNRRQAELAHEQSITPEPTLAPPTIYARPTEALIRMGSIGPEVLALQQRLKDLGYYQGEMDGQFGSGSRTAVEIFQAQHGLKADGMAGAETLAMLNSDAAQTMAPQPTPSPQP